ncbi:hypothetical protein RRG08_021965 [Elysia crispata]|uniref:PiggyBac transposable element-derived protein domain-containing protein n=1 Tax=Elysia crispata TaxID=231223 RepID=A0AAE1ACP0_9GAST|nr:hypothetical protein RRG08_021965 [Elysia crispata]
MTQATFRAHFQAQRELSVDEAMVGFKGRLSFKQYMPAKPTKWSIKVWTVSDARLGYCLGYDVYTGKGSRVMGPAADGCPHPLIDYNRFMGGVDKLDQQQSYYPVGQPGKKWWRYLVWHLISASIYNAFITWKYSPHNYNIPNSYDLMMFTADVAEGLLNGFTSRKLPGRKATRATPAGQETI